MGVPDAPARRSVPARADRDQPVPTRASAKAGDGRVAIGAVRVKLFRTAVRVRGNDEQKQAFRHSRISPAAV